MASRSTFCNYQVQLWRVEFGSCLRAKCLKRRVLLQLLEGLAWVGFQVTHSLASICRLGSKLHPSVVQASAKTFST